MISNDDGTPFFGGGAVMIVMRGNCPVCWRSCSWPKGQESCNRCHERIEKGEPPLPLFIQSMRIFWGLFSLASWVFIMGVMFT